MEEPYGVKLLVIVTVLQTRQNLYKSLNNYVWPVNSRLKKSVVFVTNILFELNSGLKLEWSIRGRQ